MANTSNQQQAAPTMEQTLNQSEAFFLKYKKAIVTVVVALIVIIAGAVLYKTYISEPNEQKASTAIAKGQEYFAQGLFEQALNGDSASFKASLSLPMNIAALLLVTWPTSMPASATLSSASGMLP